MTRWLILQKARRHPAVESHGLPGSGCLRAHGFRCCFTPLPGCFSPFPHGTCPLSVTGSYSALEGGPPCFGRSSTCSALLGDPAWLGRGFRLRGSHPLRPAVPGGSPILSLAASPAPQPRGARPPVWAPALSLAATRAMSRLISSPAGTEMFHFPAYGPGGLSCSSAGSTR